MRSFSLKTWLCIIAVLALSQPAASQPSPTTNALPPLMRTPASVTPASPVMRGLGPVVTTAFGGQVFGFDIDQNGNDGILTEGSSQGLRMSSAIELFDLKTGKITKIVKRIVNSLTNELVVDGIAGADVGLIDDEHVVIKPPHVIRTDVFDVMNPASAGKITGVWSPPKRDGVPYGLQWVSENQATSESVVFHDEDSTNGGAIPKLTVTDIAANTFRGELDFPNGQIWEGPQLVAQDVAMHQAGSTTTFAGLGSGAVQGLAIDTSTRMICVTTPYDESVEIYDLRTGQGIIVKLPGATSEQQSGGAVAADPIHHLFLVSQPLSSSAPGSTIYVYDERGAVREILNGFSFSNRFAAIFARVSVNPSKRIGYVNGPEVNELQEFSY